MATCRPRFQAFLDINNPKLERSRANFDLNHMIKAVGYYDASLRQRSPPGYRPLNRVIGGWTVSAASWPGNPARRFPSSPAAARSTAKRAPTTTPPTTSLTMPQLDQVVNFQMTGNGPMIVSPSAINPADGTGVDADGSPNFTGQVFSNPTAGNAGRAAAPPVFRPVDLQHRYEPAEDHRRSPSIKAWRSALDAFNALNHATFWVGDQNINSTTFGVISSMFYSPRIMQFGLHYRF